MTTLRKKHTAANGPCIAIKDPNGKVSQFAYSLLGLLMYQWQYLYQV